MNGARADPWAKISNDPTMKSTKITRDAAERARTALDAIEADFFNVRTGLRAGSPPEHANNENGGPNNPHNEPIIQPLYGVIV